MDWDVLDVGRNSTSAASVLRRARRSERDAAGILSVVGQKLRNANSIDAGASLDRERKP
jgi:hypothetical protein